MATTTLTISDVEVDGQSMVKLNVAWPEMPADGRPTKAMLTAMHFKLEFEAGNIPLSEVIEKLSQRAVARASISEPAAVAMLNGGLQALGLPVTGNT